MKWVFEGREDAVQFLVPKYLCFWGGDFNSPYFAQ
jgi:hypothetical protein